MVKYFLTILTFITIVIINTNDAARILIVNPVPSISHQLPFRPLTEELARRGHEVTVITTDPAFPKGKAPKNLREIDVHDISYDILRQKMATFSTGSKDGLRNQLNAGFNIFRAVVEAQLQTPEIQNLINNKNEKFNLLLLELCVRPALIYSYLFKAPVIAVSSFGAMLTTNELVGSPSHPLLYPLPFRQKLNNLTVWEKISELYNDYSNKGLYDSHEKEEDAALRKIFGEKVPPMSELVKNIEMVFLNVHPIWDDNRPVPPNVIYMGGVHLKPPKELPKDLKSYLDSSKHGVIYFSFGTNVLPSTLPPHRMQIFVNVFSKLPYDILWKYDKEDFPGKPSNVRLQKWLPQSDVLKHSKIKLFITQGGLQSTDEAITAGVPLVVFPMLGDQWFNAERYVQHNIGTQLDFETVTEDKFKNAIDTVIGDKSYRQNIQRLRDVMNDQPQKPLERAVWWAEHVIRHGGAKHLKSPAANMSWMEYYEIELIAIILASALSVFSLVVFVVYALCRYAKSSNLISKKIKKS